MSFIKTSATFGLWSDTKLRTIYGLGFTTTEGLLQFAEWFEKIVQAAKTLEEKLPLPPPAQSAVSFEDGGKSMNPKGHKILPPFDVDHGPLDSRNSHHSTISTTTWCNNETGSGDKINNNNYEKPPKTVHVVDSMLDLSSKIKDNKIHHEGSADYEMGQMTTSPMAKLAMENLQYQREVLKVKQLEIELHSMRTTVNTMHDALQRKCKELEKVKKEQEEQKEEMDNLKGELVAKEEEINKMHESDAVLQEQIEDLKIQTNEREQILSNKKDELKYLKEEVDKGDELRKENEILKERLRQLQTEFDMADKNWDTVEMASCDMGELIQGLIGIQGRLKQVTPNIHQSGDI